MNTDPGFIFLLFFLLFPTLFSTIKDILVYHQFSNILFVSSKRFQFFNLDQSKAVNFDKEYNMS